MKKIIVFLLFLISFSAFSRIDSTSVQEKYIASVINNIRANPKSFIRYINMYIENNLHILEYAKNNAHVPPKVLAIYSNNILEAKALINELNNTKPLPKLTIRMDMYSISKQYAKHIDSLGVLIHQNTQERFKSLGIFVSENLVQDSSIYGLIDLMVDSGVKNHTHRCNILDPSIKSMSIAISHNYCVQNFSK